MNLSSNNLRGSAPILSLATVPQPFIVPGGSTGSIDHTRDLTILSRLSGGVTKWASSTDSLTWTPYTPSGFTPKAPAVFGGPNQPYTLTAPAFTAAPTTVLTGEFNIASNPAGTLLVAVPRFTTPCAPRYSTNGGTTWTNATGTSGFPTQSGGFDQYHLVFVNSRFLLYMFGSGRTYSSTDGNTWTLQSSTGFFGGNGTWVPSPTTSYAISDHGGALYRYEGIGTTATEITGFDPGESSQNYTLLAPGGTSANGFLIHHKSRLSYYTGTGSTVTTIGTTTTRFPYIATWDSFNNRWLAVWADKYPSWTGGLSNLSIEASTDNGATWTTLTTNVPTGVLPQALFAASANSFVYFTRNSNPSATFVHITDNSWIWNENSFGSLATTNIPIFARTTSGQLYISVNNLVSVNLATTVTIDYRSWRYTYYDPLTSALEIRVSKTGAENSWTNATTSVTTAINDNTSLAFRSFNFLDFGDTVYMAASVDKPGHTNTGPLVLKSTNGGTSWSPSLDLRGSVTGYVITDPGQYSMAPTITLTAASTTGTQAVFAPVLRSVLDPPTITFPGTNLSSGTVSSPGGGGGNGAPVSPPEQYAVFKDGILDRVVTTRKGMNTSTGAMSMTGTFPTGSTSATGTYSLAQYTGITDITVSNRGSGYPPGRYELTITKNPADPAAGGGKAFIEIGSPNTAWQTLVGKGTGQNLIALVPSGMIDYSKGSFSCHNVFVTTNGGSTWTSYGPQSTGRSTGLHPQPGRILGQGTVILRGGIYYHQAANPGLFVYGTHIQPTGNGVQSRASMWLATENAGVLTFSNPVTVFFGSITLQTGNHLYSAVVSAATPGNATTSSAELVVVIHHVNPSNTSEINHTVMRTTSTGAGLSFSQVSALSFANLGNILLNKIDYNHRESLWVLYLADGRVITTPSLSSPVLTTVTNPGNLF